MSELNPIRLAHQTLVALKSQLYFDIGKENDYLYHGQNNFIGVHIKDQLQSSFSLCAVW